MSVRMSGFEVLENLVWLLAISEGIANVLSQMILEYDRSIVIYVQPL